MSGKLAVALLVLFCVGQVYPAAFHKSVSVPLNENLARSAIQEIIHQLNILISRIGQGIAELGSLIAQLESRVYETIGELNLPQIVIDLGKQIEKIIQEAGVTNEEAEGCIVEAREGAKNLMGTANSGVRQCLEPIGPVREQMQEQISDISSRGNEIISFISGGIGSCYREHPLNSEKLLKCLRDLEEPAGSKTDALAGRIGEAITEDKELINRQVEELKPCAQTVAEEANNQEEVILSEFRQCVSDIGSETTF